MVRWVRKEECKGCPAVTANISEFREFPLNCLKKQDVQACENRRSSIGLEASLHEGRVFCVHFSHRPELVAMSDKFHIMIESSLLLVGM